MQAPMWLGHQRNLLLFLSSVGMALTGLHLHNLCNRHCCMCGVWASGFTSCLLCKVASMAIVVDWFFTVHGGSLLKLIDMHVHPSSCGGCLRA
jgi:hypothetical protein